MPSIIKIYLDYAATTPLDPRVLRAMEPYFTEKFGNPGSLHSYGQDAMAAVDAARATIANAIGAEFREIIFTGSATEANNLALRGTVRAAREAGIESPRIIVSAIEHESVLETARDLKRDGAELRIIPVNKNGIVDTSKLASMLDERTVLVSVMYANNETGVIQPIEKIAGVIGEFKSQIKNSRSTQNTAFGACYPVFHTDAAQAFQFLKCSPADLGADLMTLSAQKIYGPKGAGALYVRDGIRLAPTMTGGGQEFGLRSGTENVPAIAGFAAAAEIISGSREEWNKKISALRDRFERGIKKIVPRAKIHGAGAPRLPHISNIHLPGAVAQDALTYLDLRGVAISAGSACRSRSLEISHVLLAMGVPKKEAEESIRVSFGRPTTAKEIDAALVVIKNMLKGR